MWALLVVGGLLIVGGSLAVRNFKHYWIAVFLGQNIVPEGYDPLVDKIDIESVKRKFDRISEVFAKAAQAMPTHREFLNRLGAAEGS